MKLDVSPHRVTPTAHLELSILQFFLAISPWTNSLQNIAKQTSFRLNQTSNLDPKQGTLRVSIKIINPPRRYFLPTLLEHKRWDFTLYTHCPLMINNISLQFYCGPNSGGQYQVHLTLPHLQAICRDDLYYCNTVTFDILATF